MVRLSKSALILTLLLFSVFAAQSSNASPRRTDHLVALCKQCHGPNLEGNALVGAPQIAGMPAWYTEAQINKMRNDVRGKHPRDIGGMKMRPLMRSLRDEQDIKDASAFVESMPKNKTVATITGDVNRGKERYALCQSCHGEAAAGNKEINAPPLTITDDWYLLTQLNHFKTKVRAGNAAADPIGSQMTAIAATLEDELVMKDILAYINTLR